MAPVALAAKTFASIITGSEPEARPIKTLIKFWNVSESSSDRHGNTCSGSQDICLTIFGERAGFICNGFLPADADETARSEFDQIVRRAAGSGYVGIIEEEGPDRIEWKGIRLSSLEHVGEVTFTVTATRGPISPADEAITVLATMLRATTPELPR